MVVVAYVLAILWALVEVVSSDRTAIDKLGWVAVILLLPVFGLVIYYVTAER